MWKKCGRLLYSDCYYWAAISIIIIIIIIIIIHTYPTDECVWSMHHGDPRIKNSIIIMFPQQYKQANISKAKRDEDIGSDNSSKA